MSILEWLTLVGLCFLGAASPGVSLGVVIDQTVKGGRQQGVYTAVAHGVGVGCYALLAALGLALVIQNTPQIFDFLRWLGAAFLLFIAYKSLTAKDELPSDGQSNVGRFKGSLVGFFTAFLNPKLALFFLAVYSQFIDVNSGLDQKLGMAGVSAFVDALWYSFVAVMVSHPLVMKRLEANLGRVQKVFGVLLILIAARIMWG
jgi:threonine/homoserine/homoserine lactone efflux protein